MKDTTEAPAVNRAKCIRRLHDGAFRVPGHWVADEIGDGLIYPGAICCPAGEAAGSRHAKRLEQDAATLGGAAWETAVIVWEEGTPWPPEVQL